MAISPSEARCRTEIRSTKSWERPELSRLINPEHKAPEGNSQGALHGRGHLINSFIAMCRDILASVFVARLGLACLGLPRPLKD